MSQAVAFQLEVPESRTIICLELDTRGIIEKDVTAV